ncbi:MAG: hypothetical protein HY062_18755 [Bacteroidetes bacterium]|nr:hypothetical protein [Bacteroidota bacterium]
MTTDQIIQDITSKDISRIRTGACEIISFSQDKTKVLPLKVYRQLIIDKTNGLDMGGAFAPNKRFVDYALEIIDFHASDKGCPCSLYSDYKYECNNPNRERDKSNISISNVIRIENKWIDYYICKCLKCEQKFQAFEREGHYMWWEWKKV